MKSLILAALLAATSAFGQIDGISLTGSTVRGEAPHDFPRVLSCIDLEVELKKLLWPGAKLNMELGPEDNIYFALTQAQINDLLAFHSARREPFHYIAEAWDCDDFAREFMHCSRVWGVRTLRATPIAPAVGVAFVKLDGPYELFKGEPYVQNVYHALNVVLRNDGQWFFIEPQNGKIVPINSMICEGAVVVVKIQI